MRTTKVAFNDPTPEGAAFRGQQAMVDADIEGLARDPEVEKFVAEMERNGLSVDEQILRLTAYFSRDNSVVNAAE